MAAKWRVLGLKLEVPHHQLDIFQANHQRSPNHVQDCLTSMFDWWLKNDNDPTYEKLAQAIAAIGERQLAKTLCEKYGKW